MATKMLPITFEQVTEYREQIAARRDRVRFLDVPPCRQLAVDGSGRPGEVEFQAAVGALYPVAYTLHFMLKRRGVEAPVGALEGLFWLPEDEVVTPATLAAAPAGGFEWRWSLALPLPAATTDAEIADAIAEVERKKAPVALGKLFVAERSEGPAAQILHVGPYDAEAPTIERLHAAIAAAGLQPRGKHHEIYVSDPGRTKADKLKTVIRQAVESMR